MAGQLGTNCKGEPVEEKRAAGCFEGEGIIDLAKNVGKVAKMTNRVTLRTYNK